MRDIRILIDMDISKKREGEEVTKGEGSDKKSRVAVLSLRSTATPNSRVYKDLSECYVIEDLSAMSNTKSKAAMSEIYDMHKLIIPLDDQITMSIGYKAKQSSDVTRVSGRIPASLGKKSGVTRASGIILASGRIPMLLRHRAELRCPSGARWCLLGVPASSGEVPAVFRRWSRRSCSLLDFSSLLLLFFSSWLRSPLKRNEGLFIVFLEWHSP
ncbi:hypothetical protein IEQ34_010943 [Dendrobium chrysotoxum]|uniref:Uncharacterized protein n=1 Tax=Dendrobium chrysotoxum TaxID=161865 RepID=A0AAV7GYF0_DENCH|nr:hypothetical protein IEQ34_010943 [Dendrobium chrysotoxum]